MIRRTHPTTAAAAPQQQQQHQPPRHRRPHQSPRLLLAAALLLLALGMVGPARAFTVDVAAGASECFTAVASTGEEVFGNYEVLTEGSYAPVEVTVRALGLGWVDGHVDGIGPERRRVYATHISRTQHHAR